MDILKIAVSALTPIAIALVGYWIQRALAEQSRTWKLQERLADRRVAIYEKIAEDLNRIYCYVMDVGGFKGETPESIISAKRNVDKDMFAYQALWPPETFALFLEYMDSAFDTYEAVGEDAKIRTNSSEKKVARQKLDQDWPAGWEDRFTGKRDPHHKERYARLISRLSQDLMYAVGPSTKTKSS